MATSAMKTPILRVASRGLSSQAQPQPCSTPPRITSTILPSKTVVSSVDQYGPVSRISVVFRAGPRNETGENRGVGHAVRSAVGLSTQKASSFAIVRNIQQQGGSLSCTGDREFTAVTLVATRNKVQDLFPYLCQVVGEPAFKPWELSDNLPRLKYEMSGLGAQTRAMDCLHKAAYRTGLGNSLFVKKDHIGTHDSEQMHHFYRSSFTANRCAVVGVNVDQEALVSFTQGLPLVTGDPVQGNGTFFGGEVRKEKNSHFASLAIATEGASLKDQKKALAFAVLQQALGAGPNAAYGGSQGPIGRAVSAAAKGDAAAASLNISYSDSGLFGAFFTTTGPQAGRVLEAVYKVFRSGSVSDADVQRGKAQLKAKVMYDAEVARNLIEDVAIQTLLNGVYIPAIVMAEAIDKISASDVNAAAQKVATGKFALAGFGNLNSTPYLDQLK